MHHEWAWLLFTACSFTAVACLLFLVTYSTRAAGFHDPIGRTLLAIKAGIFGVSVLLSLNVLIDIDGLLVRWIFSALMIQIGIAVLWQTWTILKVNGGWNDRQERG
jgi:hypothetical protein